MIIKQLKKQLNNIYLHIALLLLPIWTFAGEYQPLVSGGIPGLGSGSSLADYVNALFKIALMLGVILSVLIIAYSGFEYMTIDVATKKGAAKIRIRSAITGLLMLLGTYLILYQVNPDIVKINF